MFASILQECILSANNPFDCLQCLLFYDKLVQYYVLWQEELQ